MMRFGADAALAKPFKGAQLIEEVGKLLPVQLANRRLSAPSAHDGSKQAASTGF